MSGRRSQVSDRPSEVWCREVVCGIDPRAALAGALLGLPTRRGQVWSVAVAHDDGCPAVERSMASCTCEIVQLTAKRAA